MADDWRELNRANWDERVVVQPELTNWLPGTHKLREAWRETFTLLFLSNFQSKSVFRASMHRIPAREGIVSRMTTNSRLPPNT